MLFLVIILLVVAVVAGVGVFLVARGAQRGQAASNQVVPGRPSRAPASWAGSHDPEAVLHRRLRDAMTALRANHAFDHDGAMLDVRVELEEQALAVDEQLVAVAAVPRLHRHESLAKVTEAVNAIEKAVADLAARSTRDAAPRVEQAIKNIDDRAALLDQIRAELDRLPGKDPAAGQVSPGLEAPPPSASAAPLAQRPPLTRRPAPGAGAAGEDPGSSPGTAPG